MRKRFALPFLFGSAALVSGVALPLASPTGVLASEAVAPVQDREAVRAKLVAQGVEYLRKAQSEDGSYSSKSGPGITGLVLSSLAASGLQEGDPTVDKCVKYLLSTRRDNGGLFAEGSKHANYETCLALSAFSRLNEGGKYDKLIANAQAFLKKEQWDETEGLESSDVRFGGAGYGSKSRPDLSNTAFLIEALRESGVAEDDPAIQRALAFVSRCQNLESPNNSTPFASKSNDGGFYYTPANGGESMAGVEEGTGALRSYGSMSYAGLKSMIFAGVNKEDVRVKAVKSFLTKNYTVSSNPGMGETGLYYYLQTMAKALNAVGDDTFETADGPKDWKSDLVKQLAKTQRSDGSWVNESVRWMEGDPNLVTGYSLLTLSHLK
ncbi:Prenyltransferase and squalene oxidase repeat protein [Pirellula sp. SH-Sr6A]|uniref:prenyltransferase/squalene oxidase repeat-containing protein n=1 Tax=Pirellula sp. SH-Sr6A TaxID=1632865 RepID=UPI00078B7937|nr:prenyltransferase/squalene oxidase repeat-containing protein [Pirellula sp. SH-Sr6A]AMV32580.1 Prenyltransferase and squalene oxidase repeat protein [Pirellula sp. SH-Sr6A]